MIVVVVIGILAATAIPRMSDSIHQEHARAARQRIASDLHFARRMAIAKSMQIDVVFDSAAKRYTMVNVPDSKTGAASTVVDLKGSGLDIDDLNLSSGNVVRFDRFGDIVINSVITVISGEKSEEIEPTRTSTRSDTSN